MILSAEDVSALLPPRDPMAHKGDFGKLLLLCGSRGYTGAAYFAAMGALRAGAGLVFLGVPESIYVIEAVKLNEAVVFPLPDKQGILSAEAIPQILQRLPDMDAVVVGPGLGQSEDTFQITAAVLQNAGCPVILDADGINLVSGHKDLLRGRDKPTILTPHEGEFLRLWGPVGKDRMQILRHRHRRRQCTDAHLVHARKYLGARFVSACHRDQNIPRRAGGGYLPDANRSWNLFQLAKHGYRVFLLARSEIPTAAHLQV